eukprot:NODE_10_length_47437_cov_0.363429.p30 type:complete len:116 gc:universal NODE_10_length_47437_cov_0.363429:45326-45673(+)
MKLSGQPEAVLYQQTTDEAIQKVHELHGDELRAFNRELNEEPIKHNLYVTARANYKSNKKNYQNIRKSEAKTHGFFSDEHFVAWVRIQSLNNMAKQAGVSAKFFGRQDSGLQNKH